MPSTLEKIRILGANSKYDICASTASSRTDKFPKLHENSRKWIGNTASAGICHSYTPDGRCISLFKTLFTNKCIYNCKYCFSHSCRQRVSFTLEEYARTFMKLYSMNVVEGVFISSGICRSADDATEDMLEAVRLLRFKYNFQGYVHFKCLPGSSQHLLREAISLSDRISINSEASSKEHLAEIAEQKDFINDIITRQRWLKQIRLKQNEEKLKILKDLGHDNELKFQEKMIKDRRENGYKKFRWDGAPILNSGQTTQFVVGAAESETDWELLKIIDWQYRQVDMRRAYFSSFIPIEGTPLENKSAAPLAREHRLYQTDWLLRIYHYKLNDIKNILTEDDNLPKGDPKVHFARQFFKEHGLVDPNQATYQELIRVPGIGPISAKRMINLRAQKFKFKRRADLKSIGVVLKRADPFLKINGQNQTTLCNFFDSYDKRNSSRGFSMNNTRNCQDPLKVVGRAKGYSRKELITNLPRHTKFTPYLIQQIKMLPEVLLRNSGSQIAKKIIRMMREVSTEVYRAKQFTRTEINNRGVLFGVVLLKHDVMDLVLYYFHKRWPKCVICLYNEHTGKTGVINEKGTIKELSLPLREVVERISKKRSIIPYFDDIQLSGEEIFETLYNSQNIVERENPRYFKSMIPGYCYKLPGMRNGVEKRFKSQNRKLDDFS